MNTGEPSSDADPLVELAEEFAERYRQGQRPALTEYTDKYPHLAERIRKLFPALVVMEEFGSVAGEDTGPRPAPGGGAPPQRLGEYRILREVGRGGMGVVYEAVQESLGRHVALKVLPPQNWRNPTHLERFRREARAVARLHHTSIVPVFGVGESEGVHYYAMQFIQGQSLDSVLHELKRLRRVRSARPGDAAREPPAAAGDSGSRRAALSASIARGLLTGQFPEGEAPQPPAEAVATPPFTSRGEAGEGHADGRGPSAASAGASQSELISQPEAQYFRGVARVGVQAAEALAHAHGQGILHRDIKPANLLLDTQGAIWVTDFGLAKADDGEELTSAGDIVGTVRYMAPERFGGHADARSDVYALGLTLYEMLTLRPAFEHSDRARLIDRITRETLPAPRKIDPRIPGDLETVVLKAVAKAPPARYPTAAALAEDLQRFLTDRPIRARRITRAERGWRWCRRNPGVAVLLTAVGALLVVTVVVLAVSNARISGALGEEKRARDDLVQALYYQRIASAAGARANDQAGRAEELLDQCPGGLRGWEWHYLKRLPFADFPALHHAGVITQMAVSPDGRLLASGNAAGGNGTVKIWDLQTGTELRELPRHVGFIQKLAFSPDGRLLATGDFRTVRIWDPLTGNLLRDLPDHTSVIIALTFSPDGRSLATACRDDRVRLWDVASWQQLAPIPEKTVVINGLAFSPDGRRLLTATMEGIVKIHDAVTGQALSSFQGHIQQVSSSAFSRDARLVALGSEDGTIKVWETDTGTEVHSLEAHSGLVADLIFLDGERRLASCGDDRTLKVWDLATGQEALQLGIFAKRSQALAVSPDGLRLFYRHPEGSEVADTIGVADGTPVTSHGPDGGTLVLDGHRRNVVGLAWSPDGLRLASASWDKTAKVWDASTGREWFTLRGHEAALTDAAFSPDGRLIASSSWDETVRVWDAETGQELFTLAGRGGSVYGVAFHPRDARVLASAHHDGTIKLWDARTGQKRSEIVAQKQPVLGVAFSPDGELLVGAVGKNGGNLAVWNAARGARQHELQRKVPGICFSVAFHPNGRLVAGVATTNDVFLWDLTTGELRGSLPHPMRPNRLAFSPDGRLVTVSLDQTVRLWDVLTDHQPVEIRGHVGDVWCAAFSPDGRRLATGAGYKGRGEIRIREAALWDRKP